MGPSTSVVKSARRVPGRTLAGEDARTQGDPEPVGSDCRANSVTVALMAGGFSAPPLSEAAACSILDLYVRHGTTLADHWLEVLGAECVGVPPGEVLVLCGGSTPAPRSAPRSWRTLADRSDYRGPAGALRDAITDRSPGHGVLVVEAARVCRLDLAPLVEFHRSAGSVATVGVLDDDSPAGVYLLDASALEEAPHRGFMDLKEQFLSRLIERGRPVYAHRFEGGSCRPIRELHDYIDVVTQGQAFAYRGLSPRQAPGAGVERSVVCEGAEVDPEAVVLDSVVMPGARVGRGSVVVRSLVCERCVVEPGRVVTDAVVGPRGEVPGRRSGPWHKPADEGGRR